MTVGEAIRRVDRSENNRTEADIEGFSRELDIDTYFGWSKEFCERVPGYYLTKWLCTDSYVGTVVYYMDDEPVAVSQQPFRKSTPEYHFVSQEAADKVRKFILSLVENEEPSINVLELDQELGDHFTVEYESQLLVYNGVVDGRACTAKRRGRRPEDPYGLSKEAEVEFADGSTAVVPLERFHIPLLVTEGGN